ncbi:molybdopterin-dependent oxidoreductase [Euzebya rosea]|uniref:molybdopterin-dependent oxidoreductase n=1 Tax=Euzebya rosea TaxID=2052804 RepID=UPI000D3E77F5|nr:molybdopterin-dependent oxidoreductase [Euzebya rosea]
MPASRVVNRQCQLCEAHCGVRVHVERDVVTRIEGDPDDVMSKGYICPKGTTLWDLHRDPERLRRPLVRVGDGLEETSWDHALSLAGERMRAVQREHGRDALGLYAGNPTAHSSSALAVEVLARVMRSRNRYSASSVDQFPQYVAAHEMFGDTTLMPVADVDRTDLLVVIGANPAVSNGSITTMPDARGRLKAIRARGGRVVVVDPRRTETARLADQHVAVRPGGDPALLLGILHVLFRDGAVDTRDLPITGMADIAQLADPWTPDRAGEAAGVDAAVIADLARAIGRAERACVYGRIGVCHQPTGTVTHWLINVLNVVTGNLDRPGGAMFASPPVDLAAVLRLLWGRSSLGTNPSRVRGLRDVHGELPVVAMPEEVLTEGPGRLRGLITVAGNPALSSPESARVDEALRHLDLMISVDMYVTETTRHADIILPPVSHLERDDLDIVFPYFSVRNNLRWSPKVFEPPADSRTDWSIILRLAAELPGGAVGGAVRPLLRTIGGAVPDTLVTSALIATGPRGPLRRGRAGVTAAAARRARGGLDLGALEPRLPGILRTRDRRVHLAPPSLLEAARALEGGDVAPNDDYDLQLIGRRHLRSNNSWLHNIESMVKGRDRCTVLLHPDDAAARGLCDGDRVTVSSRVGTIEVPLEVSEDMRPGVASIPHGWGHDVKDVGWSTAAATSGVNVNLVTEAGLVDSLSGNAALNATWVRIDPVQQGAGTAGTTSTTVPATT